MAIEIEFLYDYGSPFSYVADCRIEAELAHLPVQIQRVPVYLRGLPSFREGVPFSATKLAWLARDLERMTAHYSIPFRPSAFFPVNGLQLLRGAVWLDGQPEVDAYHRAAFRAAWAESRNVADPEVAAAVAAEVGVDRAAFLNGISDSAVKARVKANTEAAIARGVFGVPTFFVGEELFWGQDRLDFVRREVERLG